MILMDTTKLTSAVVKRSANLISSKIDSSQTLAAGTKMIHSQSTALPDKFNAAIEEILAAYLEKAQNFGVTR